MDISKERELEMGEAGFKQAMTEFESSLVSMSDDQIEILQKVMNRILTTAQRQTKEIAEAATLGPILQEASIEDDEDVDDDKKKVNDALKWEIYLVENEEPNAFVPANGKIFTCTGILPIFKDENGIATLLSHEVSEFYALFLSERILMIISFIDCPSSCTSCE